ncbi:MAG: glycosyltransferase family 4 protein [Syntrophobacter sp.]
MEPKPPSYKRPEKPRIIWEGSQFVHHSLALVNRELCLQLIDKGCEVSIIPYEADQYGSDADTRFGALASRIRAPMSGPPDIHVRHQWPPNFTPPPKGRWVMIQPWEFGRLPEAWVEPMSTLVDELWVPSRHVLKTYVSSGIPADRVQVVPNGVNTRVFHPGAPPLPLRTNKSFKFLFVGGTIWRKGIDLLIQAYFSTFSAADNVALVIKDMGQDSFYRQQGAGDSIRDIQNSGKGPEILYLTEMLREHQMPGLFAACDCLVHPYRGEGFGLPILEAMACGLPVVATAGGASDDFCPPDLCYGISARRREIDVEGTRVVGGAGWVLEPNLEELKRLLRHVYENRDETASRARRAVDLVSAHYTWENAARQALRRMEIIAARPIRREQKTHGIVSG